MSNDSILKFASKLEKKLEQAKREPITKLANRFARELLINGRIEKRAGVFGGIWDIISGTSKNLSHLGNTTDNLLQALRGVEEVPGGSALLSFPGVEEVKEALEAIQKASEEGIDKAEAGESDDEDDDDSTSMFGSSDEGDEDDEDEDEDEDDDDGGFTVQKGADLLKKFKILKALSEGGLEGLESGNLSSALGFIQPLAKILGKGEAAAAGIEGLGLAEIMPLVEGLALVI